MANKFLIKRGSAAPNNAAIDNYELVYNYTDNELWTKHNGSVVKVASGNVGTVTNVVAGNGLTGGGTSTATLDLDFSELTDMTGDISGTTEFILQNGTVESRKAASEINLSAFNNDLSLSSGTVTSVTAGTGMTQSGTSTVNPTLNVVGENGLAASANAIGLDLSPLSAVGVNNLVDEDLFAVEIAIGGAIKKLTASSLKTYIGGGTITSVSGMTNNNVLTASGSTTISGESNLTFSSGVLSIDNDDVNEGGQINLLPGTGHTSTYTIDNFYGHLRFFSSATAGEQFRLTSTGNLAQLTGTKHYFNGDGGNTYIDEVASGQLRLVAGGTEAIKFYSSGAIDMYGGSTTSRSINIGANRSGNGYSYIDLVGDATYSDFGARFIRENTGPNTGTAIEHRGTGVLSLNAKDAGSVRFYTSNTERVRIDSSGNIGVGNIAPTNFGAGFTNLQISGSTAGVLQTTDSTNSATTEMMTSSGVGYVGTRSNHQVRFKSNNSTAMTIDTSQRVGIGVVSPNSLLHLYSTSNTQLRLQTTGTANASNIVYQNGTASYSVGINSAEQFSFYSSQLSGDAGFINTNGWLYWYNPILLTTNNTALKGRDSGGTVRDMLKIDANNDLVIGDSNLNDVYINQNVGIGTASPTSKVHIYNGNGSIPDDANNHLLVEDDGHSYIGIGGGTSSDTGIHFMDSGGIRGRIAYKHSSDAMDFKTANAVQMTINSSGNVGIGASSNINERLNVYHSSSADVLGIVGVGSAASTNFANINFRNLYSSATGDSAIIGCDTGSTTDKGELVFSTSGGSMNATEKMRITSGGNIGIGQVSPGEKLEVNGSIALSNNTYFKARNSVGTLVPLFRLNSSNHIEIINGNSTNGDIIFKDASDTNMTIKGDTGNVGIGVTSPQANLEIDSNTNGNTSILILENTGLANSGNLRVGIPAGNGSYASGATLNDIVLRNETAGGSIIIGAQDSVQIGVAGSDNDTRMIVNSSGNVGIGVASPGALLDVGGDADAFALIGRARVGFNSHSDYASFQHRDSASSGGYALLQQNNGTTYLNSSGNMHFRVGNADKMHLTSAGNFGIGTASPGFKLKVNVDDGAYTNFNTIAGFQSKRGADTEYEVGIAINSGGDALTGSISSNVYFSGTSANKGNTGRSSAELRFSNSANNESEFAFRGQTYNSTTFVDYMKLDNTQSLHVDGDVVAYSTSVSDKRLKDNIRTIDNALDKVMALRGVEFDWNATSRSGQHDIGLIAQEVEEIIPEVVREKKLQTGEFTDNEKTFKTIDYDKMVGVLVEAIKEQQKQINKLEEKLNG